jgi:hypothetical protein
VVIFRGYIIGQRSGSISSRRFFVRPKNLFDQWLLNQWLMDQWLTKELLLMRRLGKQRLSHHGCANSICGDADGCVERQIEHPGK